MLQNEGFSGTCSLPRIRPIRPSVWHGTTILTVRKGGWWHRRRRAGFDRPDHRQGQCPQGAPAGGGEVIGGFAGATADAFTLFERLEAKARAISRSAHARRRRAGQGLAHRPLPCAASKR
jgi:hypothetical protein